MGECRGDERVGLGLGDVVERGAAPRLNAFEARLAVIAALCRLESRFQTGRRPRAGPLERGYL
jgi:hypothetical protein